MAYDRYDTRRGSRERWRSDDRFDRERAMRDREDRGFFERAGDEIASWFGDDDAENRRRQDHVRDEREGRYQSAYSNRNEERRRPLERDEAEDPGRFWRERSWDRGDFERDEDRLGSSGWRSRSRHFGHERDYRPMTGDYDRSEQFRAAGGLPRGRFDRDEDRFVSRSRAPLRERSEDPNYSSWRQRHMDELDREYDDYARENQSRFEDDFSNWRQRRQEKRGLLGQIREHMEVVGSDDEHIGTIDHVARDRIILTKSDPESGGVHHSLSCSDIDRVEGDRVILDCKSEQARDRWRDESRSRALFEREDQGEMGPRILDRSFEGTYR